MNRGVLDLSDHRLAPLLLVLGEHVSLDRAHDALQKILDGQLLRENPVCDGQLADSFDPELVHNVLVPGLVQILE